MRKAFKAVVILLVLTLCVSATLCGCNIFNYGKDNSGVELDDPVEPQYTKYKVIKGDITISVDGVCKVTSINLENYKFSFTGAYVKKVNVKTGQEVEPGTVLVTLDSAKLEKEVANLKNTVATDTAKYNEAVASYGENSSNALKAKETLTKDQQSLSDAETQLENCTIKSTVKGVVRYINSNYTNIGASSKKTTAGETIVGVDPLDMGDALGVLSLVYDPSKYSLGIGSEIKLKKENIKTNEKIEFTTTVVGSSLVNSGIYGTAEASGEQTVVYYLDMSNAPAGISVGDNLSAIYVDGSAKDVVLINADALYEFGGKTFVYVLDSKGLKQIQYVEIGLKNSLFAEITDGLKAGDVIVLN